MTRFFVIALIGFAFSGSHLLAQEDPDCALKGHYANEILELRGQGFSLTDIFKRIPNNHPYAPHLDSFQVHLSSYAMLHRYGAKTFGDYIEEECLRQKEFDRHPLFNPVQ